MHVRFLGFLAVGSTLVIAPLSMTTASSWASHSASSPNITMLSVEPSQGFDPNIAAADSSRVPMSYMYETLLERTATGKWVGALAQSWKVSRDGKTYTFTLRPNDGFSDGSRVTASDVVFSFRRLKTSPNEKTLLSNLKRVTAVNKAVVKFTLTGPNSAFLDTINHWGTGGILSQAAVQRNKNYFTHPTATSGPWQLASYVAASQMVFKANPHFYAPPAIKQITYKFSSDPTSDVAAVESGSADFGSVDYSAVSSVRKNPNVRVYSVPSLAPTFFAFDMTKPPFNDVRVRQAVAYADDRNAIRKDCWFNTGLASYGNILIPGSDYYVPINTYRDAGSPSALAKAAALLGAAGWKLTGGKYRVAQGVPGVQNGTPLAVTVPYESNWTAAACHTQLLQSFLAKIGFNITPLAHDPASFYTDAAKNEFTMYHGGDGAQDTTDLFENWFHSGGSSTSLTTHLASPKIDAVIDKAVSSPPAEAAKLFAYLQRWQAANVPILVDGFQWQTQVVSKRIKHYKPSAYGGDLSLRMITVS